MAMAFVASFMVSATAFASAYETYAIITNPLHLGTYYCIKDSIPGYFTVSEDNISLHAYYDLTQLAFVSADESDDEYVIAGSNNGFYAHYNEVKKVKKDGSPAVGGGTIPDYAATGKITKSSKLFNYVIILSYQSDYEYKRS